MKRKLLFKFTAFTLTAFIAWNVFAKPEKKIVTASDIVLTVPEEEGNPEAENELTGFENEILETLGKLFNGFGDSASYSYAHMFYSYTNPAAESENISNMEVKYCVKKDSMFYETEDMIVVNTVGFYANVIKEQKRIVIAPSKTINDMPEVPFKMVGRFYKSNGYSMEKTVKDSTGYIRLYNPNHINCREMEIIYNSATMKPLKVKILLPDIDDPMNTMLDKTVEIKIQKWFTEQQDVKRIDFPAAVVLKGNRFVPATLYKEYGMIDLMNEQ